MPGALLNNTLSNLAGGVTEQYQEARYDSQVSSMVNCIPSITRGVLRRNPLKNIGKLTAPGLPTDISSAFIYSYDRGTDDEQYIIIIPGNGYTYVFNANTCIHLYTSSSSAYLVAATGDEPKKVFKAITIGDHTFIVNTTIKITFTSTVQTNAGFSDMAFYWIKKTASVVTKQYQDETTVGMKTEGYVYTLNGKIVEGGQDTRPAPATDPDLGTANKIAAKFASTSAQSLVNASNKAVAYKVGFTGSDFSWGDTFGDEASLGVWQTVDDADKLPTNLPSVLNGFIVQVSGGTSAEHDDYYLKYKYANKSWKEIPKPGVQTTLDPTTMPHSLYRTAPHPTTGSIFEFGEYKKILDVFDTTNNTWLGVTAWGKRKSGGGGDLDDPSFIGRPISGIFFHKNRLGFLTGDSLVLSITASYGNFFFQTVQKVLDDDPIDLAIASTDVNILRHAVSTAGTLLLFSDNAQYSLSAGEQGPLTPETATLVSLSNYTYSNNAEAKAISNKVYFTNVVGSYSQLYTYKITNLTAGQAEAQPMTTHLPTYIANDLEYIIGHDVLGYTFMKEKDSTNNELVVLTTTSTEEGDVQNAFHRWSFDKSIASIHILKNLLYIIFFDGEVGTITLEVPTALTDIEYIDKFSNSVTKNYTSYIDFSEFFVRDEMGKGTVRGRYQLRTLKYTIDDNSVYATTISNKNSQLLDSSTMFGITWKDTDTWDDTLVWAEVDPYYERVYKSDSTVTIMGNSKTTGIRFSEDDENPTKGFELATVNVEGLMYQRSTRG